MKQKKVQYLIFVALLLLVGSFVTYRAMLTTPSADMAPEARVLAIMEEGGCISCHNANPQLPFYANIPVAGDMVMKDIQEGYRAFDIEDFMTKLQDGGMPSPVDVAKIEKVAQDKRMPMAKYYLMHWGSQMTDEKATVIAEWARDYRTAYYNDGLTGERAGEPVRPILANTDVDQRKVALGYALYHDTRLSVDNTVSCATCHGLNTGGVDNLQYSKGVANNIGGVNAPTTYNAVYNFVQFWDGRAKTLAEQAAGPPLNPIEMASTSFDEIIAKLAKEKQYVEAFDSIYADGITEANITNAIEEFERTLTTPNSKFDKWLLGDNEALNTDEVHGYELFKANSCATCHVGANLGGESYELMGLRHDYFADRGTKLTEEDNGRFKQTKDERDRHRFKVPGLRNIELTWPYYHDGTRATMEEAVRDMALYQCDITLNDSEVAAIVAFMRTLTGEYQGKLLKSDNVQEN